MVHQVVRVSSTRVRLVVPLRFCCAPPRPTSWCPRVRPRVRVPTIQMTSLELSCHQRKVPAFSHSSKRPISNIALSPYRYIRPEERRSNCAPTMQESSCSDSMTGSWGAARQHVSDLEPLDPRLPESLKKASLHAGKVDELMGLLSSCNIHTRGALLLFAPELEEIVSMMLDTTSPLGQMQAKGFLASLRVTPPPPPPR